MPINALGKNAIDHLSSIDFKRPVKSYSHSVTECLKEIIQNGSGVEVTVLEENEFRVSIQAERYYESLVSDFYFSLQKVVRQRESLNLMLGADAPGAWMLVTAYYQVLMIAHMEPFRDRHKGATPGSA